MIHVTESPEIEVQPSAGTIAVNGEHILFAAEVKAKHNSDVAWKETANVLSVSYSGAGFYIPRACNPGQLVSLLVPMPMNLRRYDHDKKLYKIWGLVQHCHLVHGDGNELFHVGVAFVGRSAPPTYYDNSKTGYRVSGISDDGLWKISPIMTELQNRREPRFWKSITVSVFELNQFDISIRDEETSTENISESGASVISFLNVNVGDRVRVSCPKVDFSGFALVRNREAGPDDRPRLHLEFVNCQFPVSELEKLQS